MRTEKSLIDVNDLIRRYNLNKDIIAEFLFPGNKHPYQALRRCLKGYSELTATQMQMLANYVGVGVEELYEEPTEWKATLDGGVMVYRKGDFRASVDFHKGLTSIYYGSALIKKVMYSGAMTVTEFLKMVEDTIEKVKSDEQ